MTNPQDPNQPAQPGGSSPQGWGQPADPNQPGWAASPPQQAPGQPAWGAPPPGYQPAPGAPPPGYQPAPGWGAPVPPKKKGHGCLIAFLIVLFIFLLAVGGCVALVAVVAVNVGPYVSTEVKLQSDLGTRGTVLVDTSGGHRTWIVTLGSGYESQARTIACSLVKGDLQGTQFSNDTIQVEDTSGTILATDRSC
jgi:hypothetical protein